MMKYVMATLLVLLGTMQVVDVKLLSPVSVML